MINIKIDMKRDLLEALTKCKGDEYDALTYLNGDLKQRIMKNAVEMRGLSAEEIEAAVEKERRRYRDWRALHKGWKVDA